MRPILLLLLVSLVQPGPHAVGTRVDGAITAWYPARAGGEVMRFRDYVPLLEDVDAFLHSMKISDETIVGLFDTKMLARRNAPAKDGRFPVVLIFQGNGQNASDQAALAELIASHGYVVATIAGPVVREETEMRTKAQQQADAFASAMQRIAKWANADVRNVSAIGHSFGARSMLLFATRQPLRAMISLDGGIGTANAPLPPIRQALPPLLHLYEENDAFMKPDLAFLKSLNTKLTVERMDAMRHAHFTTWGYAAIAFPELGKATHATDRTKADVTRVAERVVAFLKRQ